MSEKPEEKKMLPMPNGIAPNGTGKKHNILHLDIDLEELFTHVPDFKAPDDIWNSKKEMSEDYLKLVQLLQFLAVYIARQINEGPEVKDNVSKRIILARTILGMILDNLAITGYDVYGILTEITQELFMRMSGKKHIMQILAEVSQAEEEFRKKESQSYTS